ncbi:hypothetical protein ACTL6U_04455 [Rhodovibrionaceae bacterium A322]
MTDTKSIKAQASLSTDVSADDLAPVHTARDSLTAQKMRRHIAEGRRLQSLAFHALLQAAFTALRRKAALPGSRQTSLLKGQPIRSSIA